MLHIRYLHTFAIPKGRLYTDCIYSGILLKVAPNFHTHFKEYQRNRFIVTYFALVPSSTFHWLNLFKQCLTGHGPLMKVFSPSTLINLNLLINYTTNIGRIQTHGNYPKWVFIILNKLLQFNQLFHSPLHITIIYICLKQAKNIFALC